MIDELLKTIPKQNNRCISTYGSINVDNLKQVVDKFKKIPDYDELIKANNKLQQALNEIEEILKQPMQNVFELCKVLDEIEIVVNKAKERIEKVENENEQ